MDSAIGIDKHIQRTFQLNGCHIFMYSHMKHVRNPIECTSSRRKKESFAFALIIIILINGCLRPQFKLQFIYYLSQNSLLISLISTSFVLRS